MCLWGRGAPKRRVSCIENVVSREVGKDESFLGLVDFLLAANQLSSPNYSWPFVDWMELMV